MLKIFLTKLFPSFFALSSNYIHAEIAAVVGHIPKFYSFELQVILILMALLLPTLYLKHCGYFISFFNK